MSVSQRLTVSQSPATPPRLTTKAHPRRPSQRAAQRPNAAAPQASLGLGSTLARGKASLGGAAITAANCKHMESSTSGAEQSMQSQLPHQAKPRISNGGAANHRRQLPHQAKPRISNGGAANHRRQLPHQAKPRISNGSAANHRRQLPHQASPYKRRAPRRNASEHSHCAARRGTTRGSRRAWPARGGGQSGKIHCRTWQS